VQLGCVSVAYSHRPAVSAIGYRRHEPERTALYRIVESPLPEFEAALRSRDGSTEAGRGAGLPASLRTRSVFWRAVRCVSS
jgi:hypothetical protein